MGRFMTFWWKIKYFYFTEAKVTMENEARNIEAGKKRH